MVALGPPVFGLFPQQLSHPGLLTLDRNGTPGKIGRGRKKVSPFFFQYLALRCPQQLFRAKKKKKKRNEEGLMP